MVEVESYLDRAYKKWARIGGSVIMHENKLTRLADYPHLKKSDSWAVIKKMRESKRGFKGKEPRFLKTFNIRKSRELMWRKR